MLDFHTHILPGIDDGSKNIETSCKMIDMLSGQSVDTVVATPHFYHNKIRFEEFKELRKQALNSLLEELDKKNREKRPKIALGAEVKFFYELGVYPHAEDLCISGTRFMLVEMPFEKWEHRMYLTLSNLKDNRDITPVIAHIERYFSFNSKKEMIDNLLDSGALIQCNTSFFNSFFTRGNALKMLKDGFIQFIGTDCHNLDKRKPDYEKALNIIKNRCEGDCLNSLNVWEEAFLREKPLLY